MSEQSEGPGWWQASDGKWYSPEQRPATSAPPPPTSAPHTTPGPIQDPGGPSAPAIGATSWVVIGGIGAALVGSFLPWATAGPFTVSGTDGDGSLTLIASLIAGGCYAYHLQDRASRKGVRIAALVLMAIVLFFNVAARLVIVRLGKKG